MQRKAYLAKNTALFALNSIGIRIITFLLVPIYTNTFGTSEYGEIDLVVTMVTILSPIIFFNIGEAVMRFSLDENAQKNKIASIGLVFSLTAVILGTSIFVVLWFFPQITINGWIVYFYCITEGLFHTVSCYLRGQEKILQYAISNILSTLFMAILNIVFLLVFKLGINGYFLAYIISYIIASIYCIFAGDVLMVFKRFSIDKDLMKGMVKYSIVLIPNSLMWWVMNSSDHVMVTAMVGIAANGIYAISYKIPSILSALSTVFNQAWAFSAIHENKSNDRVAFNNNMYDKLARFLTIVTIGLMCIMKPFLKAYVGMTYYEAWMYTPYLLVGNFFLTLATFLSTFYTVNKDSKGFLVSGTIGAAVNIILNYLLIPVIKVHGAAFATCVSYICVYLYRVYDTRKYMRIEVFQKQYVLGYTILILAAISMFINSWIGQVVLIIELIMVIVLNLSFVKECLTIIRSIIVKIISK